jgi:hypothetical protein
VTRSSTRLRRFRADSSVDDFAPIQTLFAFPEKSTTISHHQSLSAATKTLGRVAFALYSALPH